MRTAIFISFLIAIIAFMATPIVASAVERDSPLKPDLVVRSPKGKSKSKSHSSTDPQASSTSFGLPNHVVQLTTVGAVGAAAIAFLV